MAVDTRDQEEGYSQGGVVNSPGAQQQQAANKAHTANADKNLQEHVYGRPTYGEGLYGAGGYDPSKFEYSRENYDPSQLEGYSISELGSGQGYDVAERGQLQGYAPTQIDTMNFDPYRRNNLQDVNAASASGQASAEGAMARSGGLSASDRMAMASQFNRDKISGRSQVLGQSDELEAGNIFQVGRENALAQTGADRYLAGQENQGMFADQRYATDRSRYGADTANRFSELNAAAQTTANQRLGEARDELRMQNVQDRNQLSRDNVDRRYQEQGDLYDNTRAEYDSDGQLLSGNPNIDLGRRPHSNNAYKSNGYKPNEDNRINM